MSNWRIGALRVLGGLSLAVLASVSASAQTTIKFAAEDKELYPAFLGAGTETKQDKPGITVELIRATAAELGFTPVFVRAPWRRCLDMLKDGEVDAVVNGSFSAARREFGEFPMSGDKADPARKSHVWTYTLYRKVGTPIAWDGKAFSGVSGPIGAPLGYSIIADIKKMNLEVDESGDAESNLRKLAAGRIAGTVLLREATDPLIKAKGFSDIEPVAPAVEAKDYYIMLSHQIVKRDAAFAEKFWTRFAELRNAKLAEISAKY